MPDRLRCVVERITCPNPDNGYSVIKCTAKGNIEPYEETLAATVCGIEKYLGSGLVHGSGPKFAKRIVSPLWREYAHCD